MFQRPEFKVWCSQVEGFARPDWDAIGDWIDEHSPDEQSAEAWHAIIREWLEQLRNDLGGSYLAGESTNFHLLSELEPNQQQDLLAFLEHARARILRQLGDISLPPLEGKHVVLRFSNEEDYYRYVSYFFDEGEYAGSGGMFLVGGYMHITYQQRDNRSAERATLAHELTHNLLASFPLPAWLNEALAMAFELDLTKSGGELLTRELAREHKAYWNAQTIQEFWCGESFSDVEGQKLAYSLAGILLNLISSELRPPVAQFRDFVLHADAEDSGQSAAQRYLDIDLSDLVATFLGPGDWAPRSRT